MLLEMFLKNRRTPAQADLAKLLYRSGNPGIGLAAMYWLCLGMGCMIGLGWGYGAVLIGFFSVTGEILAEIALRASTKAHINASALFALYDHGLPNEQKASSLRQAAEIAAEADDLDGQFIALKYFGLPGLALEYVFRALNYTERFNERA